MGARASVVAAHGLSSCGTRALSAGSVAVEHRLWVTQASLVAAPGP